MKNRTDNKNLIPISEAVIEALKVIAAEADREAKNIGASARRGDQSKAATFRFIRDKANVLIADLSADREEA